MSAMPGSEMIAGRLLLALAALMLLGLLWVVKKCCGPREGSHSLYVSCWPS